MSDNSEDQSEPRWGISIGVMFLLLIIVVVGVNIWRNLNNGQNFWAGLPGGPELTLPTITPTPDDSLIVKVKRLWNEQLAKGANYYMVTENGATGVVYGLTVEAWLPLEVGQCYRIQRYAHQNWIQDPPIVVYCGWLLP